MQTKAGVWIDHHAAVIVELSETGERIQRIPSNVHKQLRRSGVPARGPYAALEVPADDSREREYQGQLARYNDETISHLRAAYEILIFGPGEAKNELRKRFARIKGSSSILELEPADKMTEPQIAAHVRRHFQHEAPRWRGADLRGSQTINPG